MTDDEKKYGVLEWNSSFSSMPVSGQGKIGNYALSQDFIDDIMLTKNLGRLRQGSIIICRLYICTG